jgi:hypothetical protein
VQGVSQPTPANELYNPDVPNSPATIAGTVNNRKTIMDNFYNDMKLKKAPRNGSGYTFGKTNGRLRYFDPREDSFMLDGSINPNTIKRQTDPANALPNRYAQGSLLDKYKLPVDAYKSTDNVSLVQKSRMSFDRYRNRFVLPETENS